MQKIQELFEALIAGKRVRYRTWDTDYYVFLEDGILYREDKNIFSGYFTIDPVFWEEFIEGETNKPKIKERFGPQELPYDPESEAIKANNPYTNKLIKKM